MKGGACWLTEVRTSEKRLLRSKKKDSRSSQICTRTKSGSVQADLLAEHPSLAGLAASATPSTAHTSLWVEARSTSKEPKVAAAAVCT